MYCNIHGSFFHAIQAYWLYAMLKPIGCTLCTRINVRVQDRGVLLQTAHPLLLCCSLLLALKLLNLPTFRTKQLAGLLQTSISVAIYYCCWGGNCFLSQVNKYSNSTSLSSNELGSQVCLVKSDAVAAGILFYVGDQVLTKQWIPNGSNFSSSNFHENVDI